ncbi:MAG: hypothetical protein AAF654_13230 [Myxococcota bacterium]
MRFTCGSPLGYVVLACTTLACSGDDGESPLAVIASVEAVEPGADCPAGGARVASGTDANRNGVLEADEVETTSFVCNGSDGTAGTDGTTGTNALVAITPVAPGEACPLGGNEVAVGPDINGSGVLDPDEVTSTTLLCSTERSDFDGLFFVSENGGLANTQLWQVDRSGTPLLRRDAPSRTTQGVSRLVRSPDGTRLAYALLNLEEVRLLDTLNLNRSAALFDDETTTGLVSVPFWNRDSSRFGLIGETSVGDRLFVADADGTNVRALVSLLTGRRVLSFSFQPTGNRVAVLADAGTSGADDLILIDAEGTNRVTASPNIGAGEDVTTFGWSPDGSKIFYVANEDTSRFELFVVNADGSGRVRVSPTLFGGVTSPYWSPDGARISFYGVTAVNRQELFTVRPDGSDVQTVNRTLTGSESIESQAETPWSPNSTRLAYVLGDSSDKSVLVANSDGSGQAQISEDFSTPGFPRPRWSPDSTRLAYRADNDTPLVYELYTVAADGSDRQKVSGEPMAGDIQDYQWAPDSSRIAFRADQDVASTIELYSNLPAGGGLAKLNAPFPNDSGTVQFSYAWSPDSTLIGFMATRDPAGLNDGLFVAEPDGANRRLLSGDLDFISTFSW